MKTILVTGANGQLGNEMRIVACDSQNHYIFTDVNQVEGVETINLDITDLEAIRAIVAEYTRSCCQDPAPPTSGQAQSCPPEAFTGF